jgi:methenyltetrahydrofolate cyclohydrolase
MINFTRKSLTQYSNRLASRDPVPGGGSAAALVSATGAGLICMAARYSLKKNYPSSVTIKIKSLLKKSERIRNRLLMLVDLDAHAYLGLVQSRQASPLIKAKALKKAQATPREICQLSYAAVQLIPFLVQKGNPYLLSDLQCAAEMLLAGFRSAAANIQVNQVSHH